MEGFLLDLVRRVRAHLHAIAVDGAYIPGPDGQPSFRALPRLETDEVADVLQVARVRILRHLARRGVVHLTPEARPPLNCRKVTRLRPSPQVELFE